MADKLNYKVGMIGALDMLRFKNMPKVREKAIQAASSAPLPKTLTTNEKAKQRHPEKQEVIVAEIRRNGADAKTIVLKTEDGSALAPFRAGQYISVCVPIGGTVTTRSYSLCSSPAWAKRGELERFPLFRSISQNSPLLFDKESGAIERRRSIRQIGYIRYMGSRWADTP